MQVDERCRQPGGLSHGQRNEGRETTVRSESSQVCVTGPCRVGVDKMRPIRYQNQHNCDIKYIVYGSQEKICEIMPVEAGRNVTITSQISLQSKFNLCYHNYDTFCYQLLDKL